MKTRNLVIVALIIVGLFLWSRGPERWLIRNAPAGAGPIVCFGDSLTLGTGASPEESYPSELARLLGRSVVNRGRNGDTAEAALERFKEDVLVLDPDVVILTLGGNDILRRVPVEETVRSMKEIFRRSLEGGAMVVFLAIDPPFVGGDRMERIRDLARDLGVIYLDSVMDGLWGDRQLMADRIHPNAAGYRIVAERVYAGIREYL